MFELEHILTEEEIAEIAYTTHIRISELTGITLSPWENLSTDKQDTWRKYSKLVTARITELNDK